MDLFGRLDIPREDRIRVATKFRDAGAVVLGYSLESANAEILKAMNKRVEAEYFEEQINLLREVGDLVSATSVVFGYPEETKETIAETMNLCHKLKIYPSPGFLLPLPATGMWRHAVENGYIEDTEHFLATLTERQDIVLNMTKMGDEELFNEVTNWLRRLNEGMNLGFKEENLIKTGGIQKHTQNQVEELEKHQKPHGALNPELNYASVEGGI